MQDPSGSENVVTLVQNWRANASYHVSISGASQSVTCRKGVRQGCIAAPREYLDILPCSSVSGMVSLCSGIQKLLESRTYRLKNSSDLRGSRTSKVAFVCLGCCYASTALRCQRQRSEAPSLTPPLVRSLTVPQNTKKTCNNINASDHQYRFSRIRGYSSLSSK